MAFSRKHFNMDMDWRFHRGDYVDEVAKAKGHSAIYNSTKSGGATGPATKRAFDDSEWEQVNLPHDYMREAEFSPDAAGNHGGRIKCNGWYRKTFTVDGSLAGKHAMLVFDGISTSSVIFLNGSVMERSFSVYSEIAVDVTDRLYYDRINTLAVYTKGDDTEGWWYEGAGIYRHVHLYIKDDIHIAHNGIWAKPVPVDPDKNEWKIELETTLENSFYEEGRASVLARLYDGETLIAEGASDEICCDSDNITAVNCVLSVSDPERWDVDSPKLYTLKAEVLRNGETVDSDSVRIGFRTFYMDAKKGVFLNDRPLKIKGTCNHQDHAGVGVAVPDSIQYYRIRRLKEMGTNAYRCSHNPPAKEILDACDEYGLIVMDENRNFETRHDAIRNLETLIRRDRNHPCVLFYSLFNEEPLQNSAEGRNIFRRLKSRAKRLDDTRLYLGAVNDTFHPGGTGEDMDVLGLNYGLGRIDAIRKEWPDKPLMGSENNSAVTTRGCYRSDREDAHVLNNYDEEVVPWGASVRENWRAVREHDDFAGVFLWTGFDYRGEPTPFTWPSCSSQFGIMDTCGFPKDSYYFNRATFTEKPMLHILPHWNWKAGETVRVMTVSNCDEVELFLNGRSLGRYENDICEQHEWQVAFEPGVLSAIGYRAGKAVVTAENKTAGAPVAVKLVADRTVLDNCGQDTVPVRVAVVDEQGVEIPTADHLIRFEIEGDGFVRGVGNGDPNSHEPDHLPYRHLYCGLCQVLVTAKLGGKMLKLIAHSDGLASAEVSFEIKDTPAPDYIFSKPNRAVTGILAAVNNSPEKPDPAKVYGDDDMNSFAPMILEKSSFNNYAPKGFNEGWRDFRIPVVLPKVVPEGKIPALEIASIICEVAEFYVDGKLILRATPEYKASLTVPCDVQEKGEFEVRALLKARENATSTNGFGLGITLSMIDRR
ncbi:MAG: DUF4982 domain-containing protein [Clostridia bacterium]|nr:DUF4982 domain-containing protein [Clostridia bacterium]